MKSLSILILTAASFSSTGAVTPIVWKQDTQEAFSKGDAASVSITRDGEIRLGPTLTEYADTGEEFVWSIARGKQDRIFAGTGNDGRVYRLSEGSSELLFDSPEKAIFSLTVGDDGTVYAGSSPGGLIYAIPRKGEPHTFARTDDEHVWVLIGDGRGGLYAATGGQTGRVLRVSKSGEVTEVLKTSEPNVTSLIRASDGTLYAGTDQNGLIYRVSPSGTVDIFYDTAENEVKALVIAEDGRLLAGAMNSSGTSTPRSPPGQNGRKAGGKESTGQSVVYAIRPSGSGWRLWDVPAPSVQALDLLPDGSVTVVTGGEGKVFRLYPDGSHSVLTTVDEAQPWAFVEDGQGGGWIASSGSGQVFRLGNSLSREGSLTSEPEDFSLVTRWGRIAWEGETPTGSGVSFEVRAGNGELPDETWGDWSKISSSNGELSIREARYVQYRVTLTGDGKQSPSVREISVSGLPENVQPLVVDLSVRGPHEEKSGGASGGKNGGGRRPTPPSTETAGGWKISWTGADVNNDSLVYTLHFKGRTEKTWKLLAEDLTDNSYRWDTESAPEGSVQIRLTVSDSPSNPEELALTTDRKSAPFKIDHSEPEVRITSIQNNGDRQVTVTGTISDATSYVKSAAYSLNSGPWNVLFPSDQVFDSGEEELALTLRRLEPGEYTLVIRATDSRGNMGVAKRVFDVK